MTGLLLVDKPEGITSAGVIRALLPRLGRTKAGHLGTLDPFASGLLPLCLGEATKAARYLLLEEKAYEGTIRLGVATDTLDPTGAVVDTRPVPRIDAGRLDAVARRFTGRIRQTPPMYSAIKRGGRPLYALARRGMAVAREPRDVEVTSLAVTLASAESVDFRVVCSKGTYIRSLAEDIGAALGTVAHLARLRRTRVGRFDVGCATPLETLRHPGGTLPLVSLREALADLPAFVLPPAAVERLRHGRHDALEGLPAPGGGARAVVTDGAGEVLAFLEADAGGGWRIARLIRSLYTPPAPC